jgi:DNA-binding SARP family transcriptional activator
MNSRIAQLQEFVDEDPTDPFNVYALALEFQKHDARQSITLFEQLMAEHPTYVPTYYQLAQLYIQRGHREKALSILDLGIGAAVQMQDTQALRELRASRQELLADDE